ncbi:bifunctional diaminohydroxyphosphoribosylaminopyrimidine deaminase/5-amino-6-(5-phosphoribosylamino)uracil reductase RibD [Exiguobacterium sp. SL14]|nr:bifunctional diaminohydroxyphosphoribosylaminopyrimidine deaminase/5-amino-6-(5-phosphoribosylamino)uracil reductase RibD [Exiguobacterium sp. SL14]MCY1689793.1 bifunctional diaminohydroxyphosphoribosylaminopyrimidine deaminase/5-amino-6-(5-phosphoribosylamino)uracil reductase RibD [Exiguobacterium sp. SL14]
MSQMMSYAMQLAQMLNGQTSPNPSVGCVIVKQGRILGFGAHRLFAGGPHAEVEALRMAGEGARGADLYVTLEPCNHHGKTPPCTEAILQAGIKRVFVATEDKHAIVAGSGIKRLQESGVEVEVGLLRREAEALYDTFWKTIERKRPTVTVKIAQTMNGIAATGEQRWITSEEARAHGRLLRGRHDAILVGSETVLVDDPALTLRTETGIEPIRVIVDRRGRVPETAQVFRDGKNPTYWLTSVPRISHDQVTVLVGEYETPEAILKRLYEQDIRDVLIEGGPTIQAAFFEADLVDRIEVYQAPSIFEGDAWTGQHDIEDRFQIDQIETVGPDLHLTYIRKEETICSPD